MGTVDVSPILGHQRWADSPDVIDQSGCGVGETASDWLGGAFVGASAEY
ncbi:hypothetical protein HISP_04726 [Haloarcula hispanica N601]|uniref:Uncharacterized protein n=2 Tax=Haloarcula hispanica TaxID=51589 RepID=W0GHT9_HALHI|nr:hypothetical protein HAH_0917 [Haloarcula hispanica ATCC 33960]AHF55859.1 hypothetical protein HISP_04726 [Haloarcula hispanica N601]